MMRCFFVFFCCCFFLQRNAQRIGEFQICGEFLISTFVNYPFTQTHFGEICAK